MHALFEATASIANAKHPNSAHIIRKPNEIDELDMESLPFTPTDIFPPPTVIEMQTQGVKRRREGKLLKELLTKSLTERFQAKFLQWIVLCWRYDLTYHVT